MFVQYIFYYSFIIKLDVSNEINDFFEALRFYINYMTSRTQ